MKKTICSIFVASLLLASFAFAMAEKQVNDINVNILEKNPVDWSTIVGGSHGVVTFSYNYNPISNKVTSQRVSATALGLNPKTGYTLIYYGHDGINDVWDYATCIKSGRTGLNGLLNLQSGKFEYVSMKADTISQKFWIVLSSDVDCNNNKMTAWHPSEYLFEQSTI